MNIFQDWHVNRGNAKAQLVLVAFRLASSCYGLSRPWLYLAYPYIVAYRVFVEWVLGIELPWKLHAGSGLRIFHGFGLVVNDRAVIGCNVVLRHGTTIGVSQTLPFGEGVAPVIEDDVDIGSNVVILGGVRIGRGACIGAGSVVIHDVPPSATVVGNPARVIGSKQEA